MPEPQPTLIHARFIAPIDSPLIKDGAIAFIDGRIVALGRARDLTPQFHRATQIDLGDSLMLPGFVNAHTHLELSDLSPGTLSRHGSTSEDFVEWLLARAAASRGRSDDDTKRAVALGIEQCRRFGTTCIGDISQQCHLSRPLLAGASMRGVSFGETLGLANRRARFDELLDRALQPIDAAHLRIGLSPHAPYTVDRPGYAQCIQIARERNIPLATHLAESADEQSLLQDRAGAFRGLWETIGAWRDDVDLFHGSPIAMAEALGLLALPAVLAHVNYCDDADLSRLARGRASVVYCPRTHAYFGHPPHRWREMLAAGVNVAVGTDSCASSPDLNLIDELRLLRTLAPEMNPSTLWPLITTRAALALGMENDCGSLSIGKRADFVVLDIASKQPLEELLREPRLPRAVWFEGKPI